MQLTGKSVIGILLTSLLVAQVAFSLPAVCQEADEKADKAIVLQNATIHSMGPDGTFVGTVVINDGKISAIGPDAKAPDDAKVYDLSGCVVIPGLIESRSKLWLTSAGLNEGNARCELNIVDAIDPWSEDWQELASQGITSVYAQPASSGLVGGYGAVLRVGPYDSVDQIVLKSEVAVQSAIGVRGTTTSQSRHTLVTQLDRLLTTTKTRMERDEKSKKDDDKKESSSSARNRRGANRGKTQGRGKGKRRPKQGKKQEDDKKDSDKDSDEKEESADDDKSDSALTPATIALRKVLKKELPLFVEVRHSDTLQKVLKLAEKFDIRIVVDGISRSESHVEHLVNAGFPMVVGPFYRSSNASDDDMDWLSAIGDSPFSISGFATSARSSRMLRTQAALAIRHGLNHESVLAAVTANPARALGIADQVGTLEVGKSADIAVFGGDPLDPCSQARLVMSNGKVTFESESKPMAAGPKVESHSLPNRLPASYAVKSTRMLRGGKLVPGSFTVKDSKIIAVDGDISDDITVFDLGDTIVSPGMVLASSMLGQETAIVDNSDSDTSHLRAVDAVDPGHSAVENIVQGGFVHVGISPGMSNASPGVIGHVRLSASDYVASPAIASQFVLTNAARQNGRYPSSFNGQLTVIGDLMEGKPLDSSMYLSPVMKRLLNQEKIDNVQAVVKGQRRAVIAAQSNLEIRSAIGLAKEKQISATLISSGRVGEFADQLAENKFSMIVPAMNGGEYDSQIDQIVMAQKAGVPIGFAGNSPDEVRFTAALLVSRGLDPQAALLGLTEGGGQVVGMEKAGLEKGAFADFVIWSDSPLNLAAHPLNVVVDGQVVPQK